MSAQDVHRPIFAQKPQTVLVAFSTANTNRDGTGTMATLLTGDNTGSAPIGTRVNFVRVKATGTTTAGMIRLFIDDGAGNIRLYEELTVSAIVPSGTVESWEGTFDFINPTYRSEYEFVLQPTQILKISTNNAESFVAEAFGGDYVQL